LNRIEADLEAQRKQRQELEAKIAQQTREREEIQAQLVIAGRSARENEAALSSLEDVAERLAADASAKRAALAAKQKETTGLAAALQRLGAQPVPSETVSLLGLGPQSPIDTARAAMLLGTTLPHLDHQARMLRSELLELNRVEREVRQQHDRVRAAANRLTSERRELDRLIERKQALERQLAQESGRAEARVERLAASARDIRDLLEALAEQRRQEETRRRADEERRHQEDERREALLRQQRPTPPSAPPRETSVAIRPDAGQRGLRTLPVTGRLVSNFGQNLESSGPARGLTIQARTLAVVVAPDSGRVLFAGPFRGYGQILIIEHAGGYHSLLSGLGRIDSEVGSLVRAGEPVGLTGSGRAADEGGRDLGSTLYFELRRNGQPTNPTGWLSAERTR